MPLALAFAIASGVARPPRVFILRMRNVPAIDATGIRVLDDLFESSKRHGVLLMIAGLRAQPFVALDRAGCLDRYGRENLAADLDDALARARAILGGEGGAEETSINRAGPDNELPSR